MAQRLARLEDLLSQRLAGPGRSEAGSELRSARSIVGRLDDLWVAVTEGNERLAAALARLGREPAPGGGGEQGPEPVAPSPADSLRLNRIEEALAGIGDRLASLEAGIGGRLASLEAGLAAPARPEAAGEDAFVALSARLAAALQDLGRRVDALAGAITTLRSDLDTWAQPNGTVTSPEHRRDVAEGSASGQPPRRRSRRHPPPVA